MAAQHPEARSGPCLLHHLGRLVERWAPTDGDHATAIPALSLHRRSAATAPLHCIYGFGLGIVVQGKKRVGLGEDVFDYDTGQSLLTTVDLPVVAHVTRATLAEPYLGIMLRLDARAVATTAAGMESPRPGKDASYRAMSLGNLEPGLIGAIARLVELLGEPELASRIAPLVEQEILVRLLAGGHGPQMRRVVALGSPGRQIAGSINWLKMNFLRPVVLEDLADSAHMSASTFRQHFRAVAGMSPMQYLKQLRLQEARQLMLNQGLDAGTAGTRVGYESASQFSREYARLFGAPPLRDIRRLQELQ